MKVTVQKLDDKAIEARGILSWPIWEKEQSRFDWYYDSQEECLILEGRVEVETREGNVQFGAGDFVIFDKGLSCVWNVIEPVRKHYNFK